MFPAKPEDLIKKQIAEATRKYQIDAVVGVSADCKVNLICTALKESLEKVNVENKYLLCILTTYIKREPQELQQALFKIQDMQRDEKAQGKQARVIPPHLNP